ncbi:energy transducer TonB [Roseivirga sp. E12]|uniref:energy transducer TonB n=1 Tax=Roseivirga sp. E12 TaxID=2819237 RepID=UPI001ABD2A27|nr:energy transducer TonB [Roseivirga sp. E12]MBO3697682.1 TonB family protein [Roseivirga sp. E12]
MSKPRKDKPLTMPRYRGGEAALKSFVEANLKYPEVAIEQKIEGVVEASYDVDGLGRTFNIKVLTSLGYGCDEEVIRLIKLLKFERAFNKGRNVTAHKKLKVDFKLPAAKPKTQQINYKVTSKKSDQNPQNPSQAKRYTYQINIKN